MQESIKAKITLLIVVLLGAMGLSLTSELMVLASDNKTFKTLYDDRIVPLEGLKSIADAYAVNVVDTNHKLRNGNISWEDAQQNITAAKQEITKLWKEYIATTLTEEAVLAQKAQDLFQPADEAIAELEGYIAAKNIDGAVSLEPVNRPASIFLKTFENIFGMLFIFSHGVTMFSFIKDSTLSALKADLSNQSHLVTALNLVNAVIEFDPNGKVLTANPNFLTTMGYTLAEIEGQHHKVFLFESEQRSPEYQQFWTNFASGKSVFGRFKRRSKTGETIWLQASYNPVMSLDKQVIKVVKIAQDITQLVAKELEEKALADALDGVMAVIEFDTQGIIQKANPLFCSVMGWMESEIKGKHHSIFLTETEAASQSYQTFWPTLAKGIKNKGTFKRLKRDKSICWLIATYTPVLNADNQVVKVVKFANDITETENSRLELEDAIDKFSEVLAAQALGDLTKTLPNAHFKGKLHDLKNAIAYSSEKLKEVISVVSGVALAINTSADEVADGSHNLSQRVQEQAAALEQTSAAMHQMNSQVASSSHNAQAASQLAREVEQQANNGVGVMQNTIQAMQAIQDSSLKINDIVNLIDSIAFQTNLLALNAAVEAARAGEHGRGFAVVASEVRNLAQKSAEAAKDIKLLIGETAQRVEQGSQLAQVSGETLNNINRSIGEVARTITQIAQAADEQATGISEVHQAITQIDSVTQQNAALVEETSAASESLSEQANRLHKEMAFFNTGSNKSSSKVAPTKSLPAPSQPKVASPAQKQPGLVKTSAKVAVKPQNTPVKGDEWGEF